MTDTAREEHDATTPNDEGLIECPACESAGTTGTGTSEETCLLCDGEGSVTEERAQEYEPEKSR